MTPSELTPSIPAAAASHHPRRMLILSARPNVMGPIAKITGLLLDPLRAAGCEVTVEFWGRISDTETLLDKVWGRARDIMRVRSRVSGSRFDVMIINTGLAWMTLLRDVPLLIAVRRHVPLIVLEFHGSNADLLSAPGNHAFKWAARMLFRLSDGVFLLSSEELRSASAFYPQGNFHLIVYPFKPADNDGHAVRADELPAVPTVLFAGRLVPEKGIFDTLEAFAILRARRPCRLVIAGTGWAADEVASRVATLGLSDSVTLTGLLPLDELMANYRAADIFVLPTYHTEGFPTVVGEAMSTGLPIVLTPARGLADHLEDGVHALFVPPHAPGVLADALGRLLADDELRKRMSTANLAKVRDFEPTKAAEIYLRALAELAPATGAPA